MCLDASNLLKTYLTEGPILKYPNLEKTYISFTDASKYAWACVMTQVYSHAIDGKEKTILQSIMYMNGWFWGSKLNWAALTEEANAINMSAKNSSFHLNDADMTPRRDHLPKYHESFSWS